MLWIDIDYWRLESSGMNDNDNTHCYCSIRTKDEEQKLHTFEQQNTRDSDFSSILNPPHLCFPPPQPTLGNDWSHNLIVYCECGIGLMSSSCWNGSERVWAWAVVLVSTAPAQTCSEPFQQLDERQTLSHIHSNLLGYDFNHFLRLVGVGESKGGVGWGSS